MAANNIQKPSRYPFACKKNLRGSHSLKKCQLHVSHVQPVMYPSMHLAYTQHLLSQLPFMIPHAQAYLFIRILVNDSKVPYQLLPMSIMVYLEIFISVILKKKQLGQWWNNVHRASSVFRGYRRILFFRIITSLLQTILFSCQTAFVCKY